MNLRFSKAGCLKASRFAAFSFVLLLLPPLAKADDQFGDFTYTTTKLYATITKYTGSGGDVVIPDIIKNCPVTSVASFAFSNSPVTRVVIPKSVTHIATWAFYNCSNVVSVTVPGNLATIGSLFPDSYESITNVVIWDGLTEILASEFSDCAHLSSISIPASVTNVGDYAFSACLGLTNVTLPAGVTTIGTGAFYGCSNLASINFPKSTVSIGIGAFNSCTSLMEAILPSGLTNLEDYTFSDCSSLTNVVIPDGVVSVGVSAFSSCSNLVNLRIPNSVLNLGNHAFFSCAGLTNVSISTNISRIAQYTFYGCASLESVAIPDGVAAIDFFAFAKCTNLQSLTILSNLTEVDLRAFLECPNLVRLTLSETLMPLYSMFGEVLFQFKNISIAPGTREIYSWQFNDCHMTTVVIPRSVTNIGYAAFPNCTMLRKIYFEGNAPSCASEAFSGVKGATVYYQAGTSGWESTFMGLPTVMLDLTPSIQVSRKEVEISWTQGVLMETTNILAGPWVKVSDAAPFTVTSDAGFPAKYYRVQFQP